MTFIETENLVKKSEIVKNLTQKWEKILIFKMNFGFEFYKMQRYNNHCFSLYRYAGMSFSVIFRLVALKIAYV